jgi:hypothetical protein
MSRLRKLFISPGEFWRDFLLKRYPEPLDAMILHSGSVGRRSVRSEADSDDWIPEAFPVNFPIDIVYTWVDGEDPAWLAKQEAILTRADATSAATASVRFACRGELKYSLRSIDTYAPWVNRIYLVTDGQVPTWLHTSSNKLTVVDHTEIIPAEYLPTFNSHVIEAHLHRIPGLAERYVYFNDDVMLARAVGPEYFFAANGNAHLFISQAETPDGPTDRSDTLPQVAAKNVRELLKRRFGQHMRYRFAHTFHPQLRSVNEHIAQEFAPEIAAFCLNRFRDRSDIAFATCLAPNYTYLTGRADLRTTDCAYFDVRSPLAVRFYGELLARRGTARVPYSMCLNDIGATGSSVEPFTKREVEFLERYFPSPSRFERVPT